MLCGTFRVVVLFCRFLLGFFVFMFFRERCCWYCWWCCWWSWSYVVVCVVCLLLLFLFVILSLLFLFCVWDWGVCGVFFGQIVFFVLLYFCFIFLHYFRVVFLFLCCCFILFLGGKGGGLRDFSTSYVDFFYGQCWCNYFKRTTS